MNIAKMTRLPIWLNICHQQEFRIKSSSWKGLHVDCLLILKKSSRPKKLKKKQGNCWWSDDGIHSIVFGRHLELLCCISTSPPIVKVWRCIFSQCVKTIETHSRLHKEKDLEQIIYVINHLFRILEVFIQLHVGAISNTQLNDTTLFSTALKYRENLYILIAQLMISKDFQHG